MTLTWVVIFNIKELLFWSRKVIIFFVLFLSDSAREREIKILKSVREDGTLGLGFLWGYLCSFVIFFFTLVNRLGCNRWWANVLYSHAGGSFRPIYRTWGPQGPNRMYPLVNTANRVISMCSLIPAQVHEFLKFINGDQRGLILNKWYQSAGCSINWIQRQFWIQGKKNQRLVVCRNRWRRTLPETPYLILEKDYQGWEDRWRWN